MDLKPSADVPRSLTVVSVAPQKKLTEKHGVFEPGLSDLSTGLVVEIDWSDHCEGLSIGCPKLRNATTQPTVIFLSVNLFHLHLEN